MLKKYIKHHIQRSIFQKIAQKGSMRYADIKIDGVESSLFVYHLKELMRASMVEKDERGKYRLTKLGVTLSQHYSEKLDDIRMAVPGYTVVFLRSDKGNWLMYQREKAPFVGFYSTISGKMHHGETLQKSVQREMEECLVIENNVSPELVCFSSIVIHGAESNATTHIVGPVWFADEVDESLINQKYHKGQLLWKRWVDIPYQQFIPGWKELLRVIKNRDTAMLDLEMTVSPDALVQ